MQLSIMLPFTKLFRYIPKRNCMLRNKSNKIISDKPLGNKFFHPNIQFCMKNLITVDYEYIYRKRRNLRSLSIPRYELLTDSEVNRITARAHKRAENLLQLPPIIDVTSEKVEILSEDSSLDGHDKHHSKITFTDLSFGFNQYERLVVVREPNGILRTANKDERSRMELTFFPQKYREIEMPKMFEIKHLEDVIERKEYEFILDRACMQFEPDDEAFHRVLKTTYDAVNKSRDFHLLEKTRHIGSLAFYLAVRKEIDRLLKYFVENSDVIKGGYLIKLQEYTGKKLSDLRSMDVKCDELTFESAFNIVMDYIMNPKRKMLQLRVHLENLKDERNDKNVLESHGIEDNEDSEKLEDLQNLEVVEDDKNSKGDV